MKTPGGAFCHVGTQAHDTKHNTDLTSWFHSQSNLQVLFTARRSFRDDTHKDSINSWWLNSLLLLLFCINVFSLNPELTNMTVLGLLSVKLCQWMCSCGESLPNKEKKNLVTVTPWKSRNSPEKSCLNIFYTFKELLLLLFFPQTCCPKFPGRFIGLTSVF